METVVDRCCVEERGVGSRGSLKQDTAALPLYSKILVFEDSEILCDFCVAWFLCIVGIVAIGIFKRLLI